VKPNAHIRVFVRHCLVAVQPDSLAHDEDEEHGHLEDQEAEHDWKAKERGVIALALTKLFDRSQARRTHLSSTTSSWQRSLGGCLAFEACLEKLSRLRRARSRKDLEWSTIRRGGAQPQRLRLARCSPAKERTRSSVPCGPCSQPFNAHSTSLLHSIQSSKATNERQDLS